MVLTMASSSAALTDPVSFSSLSWWPDAKKLCNVPWPTASSRSRCIAGCGQVLHSNVVRVCDRLVERISVATVHNQTLQRC
jgi:hypothetical protein